MSESLPEAVEPASEQLNVWRQRGIRAVCSLAGGLLAAAPLTGALTETVTEVHDTIGAIPATVSFAPGHSSVETGFPAGTLYSTALTAHGYGASIRLEGPPNLSGVTTRNLKEVVRPYVGMFHDPRSTAEGYAKALQAAAVSNALKGELGIGTGLGGLLYGIAAAGAELSPKRRKTLAGVAAGGLALLSVTGGAVVHVHWTRNHVMPTDTYSIADDESSLLGSVKADSPTTAAALQQVVPFVRQEANREKVANETFIATAQADIDEQLAAGNFVPPTDGETMVLAMADLHSNQDMISVYQHLVRRINELYGKNTIRLVAMAGDETYGSAAEEKSVEGMVTIAEEDIDIDGNHDGKESHNLRSAAGAHILENSTVLARNGLKVSGGADPEMTPLSALFGFSENVSRHGDEQSEAGAGQVLQKEAEKTQPNIMMIHEPYELAPILDKNDITQENMQRWYAGAGSPTSPVHDTIPDIAAKSVLTGHWHKAFKVRTVWNSDDSWTTILQLPSAGGAPSAESISTFSTPWTTPAQEAGAVCMTFNDESGLVTGLQEFTTETDGRAAFDQFINVGTPGGQPGVLASQKHTPRHHEGLEAAAEKSQPRTRQNAN